MTNKHTNLWWGPPKDFSERKHQRKISWLELFYDLVYVAAIAQLTHHIASHPSLGTISQAFLLFCLVFWSWVNGSQYYDLHGNDGIRTRILTFWQMLAVAAVAITIPDTFEGNHKGFAISFAIIQSVITYLWWSVGLYDRSHRVFNIYFTVNYSIAFCVLIISIFTNPQIAFILWTLALLLNLSPALIGAKTIVTVLRERGQVFSASEALVERFGLFTIIVLAESILGVVTSLAEVHDKQLVSWLAFVIAILISFLLWSIYFDMTSEQETKSGYSYLQWLIFLHYPLLAALSIVGACLNIFLAHVETDVNPTTEWLFCSSISLILFTTIGIASIMKEEEEDRSYIRPVSKILLFAGILIILIPCSGASLSALTLLSVVTVILFVPVFLGIKSWVRYKFSESKLEQNEVIQ